jgi:hypothetical protein
MVNKKGMLDGKHAPDPIRLSYGASAYDVS